MRKKFLLIFLLIFFVLCVLSFGDFFPAAHQGAVPESLPVVSNVETLTEETLHHLFQATGLGKPAVLQILESQENYNDAFRAFYEQKQEALRLEHSYMFFPTTKAELLLNERGGERRLMLPELKAGDILLTKSTKTLLYRHGHAALVLDEDGTTIESFMLGVPSDTLSKDGWTRYSTLMVLRPKAEYQELAEQAVSFAKEELLDLPYNLLTGVVRKDKSAKGVDSTHCAHLVWQAYYQAGLDLDFDGGWLVTPHDISKSPALELVFSYGY